MHPYVNTAIKAAREAGEIIMRAYARPDLLQITQKSPNDFVTDVDKASEDCIIDILLQAYPDHSILAEESGEQRTSEYQWIIDPLDGTTNFVYNIPHFCISIALVRRGVVEHGVIYDPVREDLYTASRGQGARRNDRRIRVSQKKHLSECLIGAGFSCRMGEIIDPYFDILKSMGREAIGLRHAGSAALDLAYTAAGQVDCCWQAGLKPWDMAAGMLMIREAGGLFGDFSGGENSMTNGQVVAGNPKIFKELLTHIKQYFTRKD